jgi:hypothetical protein
MDLPWSKFDSLRSWDLSALRELGLSLVRNSSSQVAGILCYTDQLSRVHEDILAIQPRRSRYRP